MKQYTDLIKTIIEEGSHRNNRTGVPDIFIPGAMLQFKMSDGFPIDGSRRVPFKSPVGEMIGFIKGASNSKEFEALKCKYWDKNANDPGLPGHENKWLSSPHRKGQDDLGEVYGRVWRGMLDVDGEQYDQFSKAIEAIQNSPDSRRILVSGWRPDRFDHMALPPCHVMHQWVVDKERNKLHLLMYQRSADTVLGIPSNIIEYAWLLEVVAHATGYQAGTFTHFIADAHIFMWMG